MPDPRAALCPAPGCTARSDGPCALHAAPTVAQLQAENALLKRALSMLVRSLEDTPVAPDQ